MPQKVGVLGVVLAIVALVCSCVALGIPYWQKLYTDTVTGNHGLFRYTFISAVGVVTYGDYLGFLSGSDRTSLKAVWGLIISGAILLLFVALFGLIFTCCVERKGLGIFTAVLAFLSAAAHTAGTLVFRYSLAEGGNSSLHAGFYLVTITSGVAAAAGGFLLKAATAAAKQNDQFKPPKPKRDPSKKHISGVGVLGVVLAIVALVCSCVALGIPYWQDLDTGTVTGNHGLFRYTFTSAGTAISGNYVDYVSGSDRTSVRAIWGLMFSGAILLLLASMFGLMFVCLVHKKGLGHFTAAMMFLSAMLHTASSLVFRYKLAEGGSSSLHAGFYLATIAAAVSGMAGGFLVKATRNQDNNNKANPPKPRQSSSERHHSPVGVVGVVFAVLALLCCALALGLPYWQDVDTGTNTGKHGLFRYTFTAAGVQTSGNYIDWLEGSARDYLRSVRALVIAGLCCVLLALVALLVFLCKRGTGKWLGYLGAVGCLITAALLVTGVIIFAVELEQGGNSSYHAAFYLAIATATLALIAGILAIVATARTTAPVDDQQRAVRPPKPRQSSSERHSSSVGIVGVVFAVLALLCCALALGLPYWQDVDTGTNTGKHGLFRYTFTAAGVETSGNYIDLLEGSARDYLRSVRALVIAGLSCVLLALVALLVFLCKRGTGKWLGYLGGVGCLITATLLVTSVVIFAVELEQGGNSSYHAAFYLAIATTTLALIAGILAIVATARTTAPVDDQQRAVRPPKPRQSSSERHSSPVGIVGVVFAVLALLCCALALGLPYWQDVDTGTNTGKHGLFRYTFTAAGVETSGNYIDLLEGSARDYLWSVRALVIAGLCCVLLALVALLVFLCKRGTGKWLGYLGGVGCLITAALLVTGVIIFAVELEQGGNSSYHAAFYLAIATATLALIAGILAIVATARTTAPVDDQQRDQRPTRRPQRENADKPARNISVNEKVTVAGVVAFLVIVCSSVSLGIPYWQDLDSGTTTTGYHGLFRYSITVSGVETSGDYLDRVTGSDKDALYAVRGLVGSGTAFTLLGFIAIVVFIVRKEQYWAGFVGAALCFLSGAVHVTAVVVFRVKLALTGSSGLHAGFYLAIVAAVFACTAATIAIVAAAIAWYKLSDDPEPIQHNQRKPAQQRQAVTDSGRPAADQHRETAARNDASDYRQPRRQEPVMASPVSQGPIDTPPYTQQPARQANKPPPKSPPTQRHSATPDFEDDFEFNEPRTIQQDNRQKFRRQNKVNPARVSISTVDAQWDTVPTTRKPPPYSKQAPVYSKPSRTHGKPTPAHDGQWPRVVLSETEMDLEQRRQVWQREAVKLGLMKY